MKRGEMFTTAQAVAQALKLSGAGLVTAHPAPFSIDLVSYFETSGEAMHTEISSSAMFAAVGAAACEKRSFAAITTIDDDCLRNAISMRIPFVFGLTGSLEMNNVITMYPDGNQDIFDSVIHAYKIAEDKKIMLPVCVFIEDTTLIEPVYAPILQTITGYLGNYRLGHRIDYKNPAYVYPSKSALHKQQSDAAMKNAHDVAEKSAEKWGEKFKRNIGLIETIQTNDADTLLVTAGIDSYTARNVIQKMRSGGEKIGMARIRFVNPFPYNALKKITEGKTVVALGRSGYVLNNIESVCGCSTFFHAGNLTETQLQDIIKKGKSVKGNYWV